MATSPERQVDRDLFGCNALDASSHYLQAMKVEVIRSAKRRRTVQARTVGDVLRVSVPATMTKAEEDRFVGEMVRRMERRTRAEAVDLAKRATVLAVRHGLDAPDSIRWVDNQECRWGSCTPSDRSVRISSRVAGYPPWVLDYVIVHELAHLRVAGHGPSFWVLVGRYPKTERARGFLMAKGLESDS
ncbi:MAG: M48 family metallopeptidase [Acidimicrobiales bacterium]